MSEACPFATLGLAPSWPVDAATVHRARLGAAARFHPDRARDAVERADFEVLMGSANRAAEQLLDPVLAAGAVLRAAGLDATELPLPPMELVELLERREWFEERIFFANELALHRYLTDRITNWEDNFSRMICGIADDSPTQIANYVHHIVTTPFLPLYELSDDFTITRYSVALHQ